MDRTGVIVAVSSPPGRSLRGIVRASGPQAFEILDLIVDGSRAGGPGEGPSGASSGIRAAGIRAPGIRARGIHRITLAPPLAMPTLLLSMPAPESYTGEDSFELLPPGNPLLLARIVDAIVASHPAARRAEPGEFSARAFINGRLTLEQAEGVAAAIRAEDDVLLAAARRMSGGSLGLQAAAWSARVAEMLALVEAGIDFTDQEDVIAIKPEELAKRATLLRTEIFRAVDAGESREASPALPRVVLAGEPNVGKSSLFNALLGRRRTVAGPQAGTTRDAIEEELRLDDGSRVILVDAPGVAPGTPAAPLDRSMRGAALAAHDAADLLLRCHAAGGPQHPLAEQELQVITKCDLGAPAVAGAIATSSVTGAGLSELRRAIAARLSGSARATGGAASLLPRHSAALTAAARELGAVSETAAAEQPGGPWLRPELAASSLRAALDHLGAIAGRMDRDEVLALVFGRFCIGK